jgi:chromate reductase
MKLLGIAGSLRSGSLNRELLRRALAAAPEDVEVETWDGLRDIPPYDQDLEHDEPAAVAALREAVRSADAVLLVTPE